MDRISNLPDNVIQLILDRLPVIDRVRTSALSPSWRFHWKHLPSSLYLDSTFHNSLPRGNNRKCPPPERIRILNSLLMQHNISQLQEFSFHAPFPFQAILKVCFGQTIRIVPEIDQSDDENLLMHDMSPSPHTLPPFPIFSSLHLTHLSLSECAFCHFPWFQGFPNLKSFKLVCPLFCSPLAKSLSCFISSCPQLQELKLYGLQYHNENLDLNAPLLRSLIIGGNVTDIALKNAQNLESFDMSVGAINIERRRGYMFEFLHFSTRLTDITLQGRASGLLALRGTIHRLPTLNHVKTLRFSDGVLQDPNVLECVIGLCARSPNLEQINISVSDSKLYVYKQAGVLEFESLVQKYINGSSFGHHLRRINLVVMSCTVVETKLMELFLGKCIALEKMYINFCKRIPGRIIHRIKKYHRASAKAKIVLRKKMQNDELYV